MRWRMWITIACATALLAPATASAGFGPTIDVSAPTTNDVFPQVATDADGRSVVVWKETSANGNVLRFRRVHPDGSMGAATTLSDDTLIITQFLVKVAPTGRALAIWTESTAGIDPRFLRARWIEVDDSLGPQLTLRTAGVAATVNEPALATTTDGDAVVAWRNARSTPGGKVEARRVGAAGTLGPLLQPTEGPNLNGGIGVAPNPAGGALVAWVAPPGIAAMPVDTAGAAGAVVTPVAAGVLGSPRLSSGGLGAFHLLWIAQGPPAGLTTLTINATGVATGTPQLVDGDASPVGGLRLATNAADRSLGFASHADATVAARFFGADGTPQGSVLTAPAQQQFILDAAVLGDGSALAFWSQGPSAQPRALMSRAIAADGTASAPEVLSPTADAASFATTPGGIGLVAWQQRTPPTGGVVQVRARLLLPPPVCPDAAGTVVQGRPTTVTLTCTGLQLTAPEVLSGPSQGTLGAVDAASASVVYTPRPGFAGVDSFTFRGTNQGGPGAVQTARVQVGRDTVAPKVSAFRISAAQVRLRASFKRPLARRPAFVLRLSEPATVKVTITRKRAGRFRAFRVLRTPGPVTSASLRLLRPKLVPGAYRATVVVTDAAGNASASRRIGFVVVA